jgi:hypothetical protein
MARRATAILATALGLALLAPGEPAWASLSISANPPATAGFAATLDGTDQTAAYTLPVTVADTAGTVAGWRLTMRATVLTSPSGTLPAPAVTAAPWVCASACTTNPTNSVALPVTVPTFMSTRYFNAAANTGIGTFTVTPTITVTVPANARAGSYTSTVTTTLASGP